MRVTLAGRDPTDAVRIIEEAGLLFRSRTPAKTLLSLIDLRGLRFDPSVIEAMKRIARANAPWILASSVVGLSAIGRILYRMVAMFSGRNFAAFATLAEAEEWLLAQAGPPGSVPGPRA